MNLRHGAPESFEQRCKFALNIGRPLTQLALSTGTPHAYCRKLSGSVLYEYRYTTYIPMIIISGMPVFDAYFQRAQFLHHRGHLLKFVKAYCHINLGTNNGNNLITTRSPALFNLLKYQLQGT